MKLWQRLLLDLLILLLCLLVLWNAGAPFLVHAGDTGYRLKVVMVDRTDGYMEAKFVQLPEDLRVVCHGKAEHKIFEGDYVKVEWKDKDFTVDGMNCNQIRWYH